ncbi:hypothetical protein [Kribbella sp. VKM Ac-2571]|uniref:hypothetical protein n=1 Tax=Kribbella sp. VKM Ac-2571 TaxID=2512222 RepID=UPI00192D876C|nr:hypothetical protein [Kribbella sp. VKM Ac-2571]
MHPLAADSTHPTALPGPFAHSVVPIVLGYVIAHYATMFLLEGQHTLILLSDPLSRGWNVFRTAHREVNTGITAHVTVIATVQMAAVVGGHLLGVMSAYDRCQAVSPAWSAERPAATAAGDGLLHRWRSSAPVR